MKQLHRFFLLSLFLLGSQLVSAASFVLSDIRLEGLQRVDAATVFRSLPVARGEKIEEDELSESVRALFGLGYFDDVQVAREKNVLIFKLKERPSIALIRISGNELIKTEPLLKALNQGGLKEGDVLRKSTLEQLKQELVKVYAAKGHYGTEVEVETDPLSDNRITLNIRVYEGEEAIITHINIVGNKIFDDETLTDLFSQKTTGFWSFYAKDDRYAKEKLAADLERLKSFYLDQGYIKFSIDSTQISISPEKDNIYITINVTEGGQYRVKDVALAGDIGALKIDLSQSIDVKVNRLFSRKDLVKTQTALSKRLADVGYMFAKVTPDTKLHDDKTVSIKYFVQPGKKIYVRRILIRGNTITADDVIRREMRQIEASLASDSKIQASKKRLERTGYFASIDIKTLPVAGTEDQVDLEYKVVPQSSGHISASLGFTQGEGAVYGLGLEQKNFLGSGYAVAFEAKKSSSTSEFNFSVDDPYYTVDGVSRSYNLYFRERNFDEQSISSYKTDVLGAGVGFGYPIDETQRLNFGFNFEQLDLKSDSTSGSKEVNNFVAKEGNSYLSLLVDVSWVDNQLNKGFFPTEGIKQYASLEIAAPGSDLDFYKATYDINFYKPLTESHRWSSRYWGRVGYTDSLMGGNYPFFKHFFAGGVRTVRGFRSNTLGPKDSKKESFGGNVLLAGGAELIMPSPLGNDGKTRTTLFLDAGNVFSTDCEQNAKYCKEGVRFDDLRYSAGLTLSWLTAVGPLSFILSQPLNAKPGDKKETFYFSIGTSF